MHAPMTWFQVNELIRCVETRQTFLHRSTLVVFMTTEKMRKRRGSYELNKCAGTEISIWRMRLIWLQLENFKFTSNFDFTLFRCAIASFRLYFIAMDQPHVILLLIYEISSMHSCHNLCNVIRAVNRLDDDAKCNLWLKNTSKRRDAQCQTKSLWSISSSQAELSRDVVAPEKRTQRIHRFSSRFAQTAHVFPCL